MTTLATLKNDLETHMSITISNADVVWAYNEFDSMVYRRNQSRYNEGMKLVEVSIPTTGYALSNISDLRSASVGLRVILGKDKRNIKSYDVLQRIHPAISYESGFYIEDGSLYLKNLNGTQGAPTIATEAIIEYRAKRVAVASDADLTTTDFGHDQDLEFAFRRYLQNIYFDGKYRPENVMNAQALANQWLDSYFSEPITV